MSGLIRLLVVDDHALFRRGLVGLLSEMPEFEVVGEADNGLDAVKVAMEVRPDVILLDVNMPGMSGIETLEALRRAHVTAHVLVLTISQQEDDLVAAIVAGADGYLLKNAEPAMLRETIRRVAAGEAVLSPEMTDKVFQALRRVPGTRSAGMLSSREMEVLRCLARGMTTAQVAEELFISENTVKTHVRHILEKLDVNNRAQAVAKASQMGLL